MPAVALDLAIDARLSPSYVASDEERVGFYGRFAEAPNLAAVSRLARELRERDGPFPVEVKAFVGLTKLRHLAAGRRVATISERMTDAYTALGYPSNRPWLRRLNTRTAPGAVAPSCPTVHAQSMALGTHSLALG